LIDWKPIEQEIRRHYALASDVVGWPAYPGLLLVGLWHGGLSDEAVEDMANVNLHVLHFLGLGLALENDVPDNIRCSCALWVVADQDAVD
jgi:IS5 family transposase